MIAATLACGFSVTGCTVTDETLEKWAAEAEANAPAEPAEVLFVIDSSASMDNEAAALVENIDVFARELTSGKAAGQDYRIGITTTDADTYYGFLHEVEPGEAGTLVAAPVSTSDDDLIYRMRQDIACMATCWDGSSLTSDPGYSGQPGDCPLPSEGITVEYLDCLCHDIEYPVATATWDSSDLCGGGHEQHLESALLALCLASPSPRPDICSNHTGSNFKTAKRTASNNGWPMGHYRDDTPVVIVVVTDEGDGSPMFSTKDDTAEVYLDAFAQFDRDVTVAVIGPSLDCTERTSDQGNTFDECQLTCNTGNASKLQTERLFDAAEASGGTYFGIANSEEGCAVADFGSYFKDIAALVQGR